MSTEQGRRYADGSIDYDFYRARAADLRVRKYGDLFRWCANTPGRAMNFAVALIEHHVRRVRAEPR